MSEFIKNQSELRANLFSQIKDVIESAETEGRGLDSAELTKIDRIESEIDAAQRSIETAQKNEERMIEVSAAAKGFVPANETNTDEALLRSIAAGEVRSGDFEFRTLTSSVNTVPTGFADQVFVAARSVGPILETSEIFNTQSGENIVYPVLSAYSVAEQKGEGVALPSDDPTFSSITLGAKKFGVLVPISNELLADSGFNIESVIAEQAGNALGFILNNAHTVGDGQGANVNGIVTASTLGVTGAGTAPTADEIIDLLMSINPAYRMRNTFGFMASTSGVSAIRKLKDGDGRFIYDIRGTGEADTLLGYTLHENVHMAAVDNSAKSLIAGDLANYKVRLAGGIQVAQSSDFAFSTDITTYRVIARADGNLANDDAVKHFIGIA